MFPQLYFAAIVIASFELIFIGVVISYFQKKIYANDVAKLGLVAVGSFLFLILGQFVGKLSLHWFSERSAWYGATIIFILGLKLFYDRIKLGKVKQLINPLETKGLFTLTLLQGINIFFVGLASGLLNTSLKLQAYSLVVFIVATLLGLVIGLNTKKPSMKRFEFVSGILYIIIAILVASNI